MRPAPGASARQRESTDFVNSNTNGSVRRKAPVRQGIRSKPSITQSICTVKFLRRKLYVRLRGVTALNADGGPPGVKCRRWCGVVGGAIETTCAAGRRRTRAPRARRIGVRATMARQHGTMYDGRELKGARLQPIHNAQDGTRVATYNVPMMTESTVEMGNAIPLTFPSFYGTMYQGEHAYESNG